MSMPRVLGDAAGLALGDARDDGPSGLPEQPGRDADQVFERFGLREDDLGDALARSLEMSRHARSTLDVARSRIFASASLAVSSPLRTISRTLASSRPNTARNSSRVQMAQRMISSLEGYLNVVLGGRRGGARGSLASSSTLTLTYSPCLTFRSCSGRL
jgi:hypothetical protein